MAMMLLQLMKEVLCKGEPLRTKTLTSNNSVNRDLPILAMAT